MADTEDNEQDDNVITVHGKPSNYRTKWITYYIFLISALPFIICMPQYSHQFWVKNQPQSWMNTFYSSLASNPDFFEGTGSATGEQFKFYSNNAWTITLHTAAGSGWLIFGFIQFNTFIRSNYIKIHRISGYAYFTCLIVSLIGSGSMLFLELAQASERGDLSLIYSNNGAYHIYLCFYWVGGVATGKAVCTLCSS